LRMAIVLALPAMCLTLSATQPNLRVAPARQAGLRVAPARQAGVRVALALKAAPPRSSAPQASLASAAAFWCPMAGLVTSNALYFSPLSAVLERLKVGTLGELNPLPAAVTVLSTLAWLQYGLAIADPFVVASNIPGLTAAIAGFVLLLPLMKGTSSLKLVQTSFVTGCAATLALWTWLVFSGMTAAARASALGLWASAFFIVLCSSPLTSMRKVIQTKDASSIYAPMTAAQCANCLLWTVYGYFGVGNIFVWGPNFTGLLLSFAQLGLKVLYPSKAAAE